MNPYTLPRNLFLTAFILLVIIKAVSVDSIIARPLNDYDEARYAEVAKNIIKTGEVLIPLAGGPDEPAYVYKKLPNKESLMPFFWKPPLLVWLQAFFMNVVGVGELAARLPSLLASAGILILIHKIFKIYKIHDLIAFSLMGVFVLSYDFSYMSTQGTTDALVCLLGILVVYCAHKSGRNYPILAGALTGLAILTKSIAVFWIPILYILSIIVLRRFSFRAGIFYISSAIVVAAPWFLFMVYRFGDIFIIRHFLFNMRGGAEQGQNFAPLHWYLIYTLDMWKPAIFFAPLLIFVAIHKLRKKDRHFIVMLIWIGSILIPFSIAKSKVWWYIYSIWPAYILLTGLAIQHIQKNKQRLIVTMAIIGSSLFPFWTVTQNHIPLRPFLLYTSVATGVFFFFKIEARQKYSQYLPVLLIIALICSVYYFGKNISRWPASNADIKQLAAQNPGLTNVGVYGHSYEAPLFYFDSGYITTYNTNTKYLIVQPGPIPPIPAAYKRIDQVGNMILYKRTK